MDARQQQTKRMIRSLWQLGGFLGLVGLGLVVIAYAQRAYGPEAAAQPPAAPAGSSNPFADQETPSEPEVTPSETDSPAEPTPDENTPLSPPASEDRYRDRYAEFAETSPAPGPTTSTVVPTQAASAPPTTILPADTSTAAEPSLPPPVELPPPMELPSPVGMQETEVSPSSASLAAKAENEVEEQPAEAESSPGVVIGGAPRVISEEAPPASEASPAPLAPPMFDDRYGNPPRYENNEPTELEIDPYEAEPAPVESAPSEEPPTNQFPNTSSPYREAATNPANTEPVREGRPASYTAEPRRDAPPRASQPQRNPLMVGTGVPGEKSLEGAQAAQVLLERRAPAEMQVGQAATIELVVRNQGLVAAQQVEVSDEIPRGARLVETTPAPTRQEEAKLFWKLGTLGPNEESIIRLQLMPLAEGEIGSVASVTCTTEATSRTLVTEPRLKLQVLAAPEVLIDEEIVLKIKVSNEGSGTARQVKLRETIPRELRHPAGDELEYLVGDLAPGKSQELQLALRAVEAGVTTNLMQVFAQGEVQSEVSKTKIAIVSPALQVTADGPSRRFLEREAEYTISVSNPGTAPAKQVSLKTVLPEGMKFVKTDSAGRFDPATRSVHWLLDELPAQRTGSVKLTVLPIAVGDHTFQVNATADRGLQAQTKQTTAVEGVAAVLFQVVDLEDPVELDGETVYEIRLVNQGSKASSNLQVAAELSPAFKFLNAEGETPFEVKGNQILFQPIPKLAPKANTTFRVRVQGIQSGDGRFRVQLLTDEMSRPVTKEESTRIYSDE